MVILIAEDNLGVRVWLWQLLKNDGHTVIAVKDGEDALNASRAHSGAIDLVITDVKVPRLDGVELHRIITAERPHIKVILMSGDHGSRDQSTSIELPFLQKPFQPSTACER